MCKNKINFKGINRVTSFTPLEKIFKLSKKISLSRTIFFQSHRFGKQISFLTGFTLVELLIVVIIIGVLASVSIPNFTKTYYNLQLSNASSDLAYLMRYARVRSIIERKKYRLSLDSQSSRYWIEKESANSATAEFEKIGSKFGKIVILPAGIKIDCELNTILFYPNGAIDNAVIYLSNKNNKFYTIQTTGKTGYVQVFDDKI